MHSTGYVRHSFPSRNALHASVKSCKPFSLLFEPVSSSGSLMPSRTTVLSPQHACGRSLGGIHLAETPLSYLADELQVLQFRKRDRSVCILGCSQLQAQHSAPWVPCLETPPGQSMQKGAARPCLEVYGEGLHVHSQPRAAAGGRGRGGASRGGAARADQPTAGPAPAPIGGKMLMLGSCAQ